MRVCQQAKRTGTRATHVSVFVLVTSGAFGDTRPFRPESPAIAHQQTFDGNSFASLDLVVTEPIFDAAINLLDLDSDQRDVATVLFQSYYEGIRALDATTTANAKHGLNQMSELNAAARLNARAPEWTKIKAARADYETQLIAGLKESDVRLEDFLGRIYDLLREDQRERHAQLPALVRRMSAEQRTEKFNRSSNGVVDFSYHWNIPQLIADARAKGGEFENIPEEFAVQLIEIMDRYDVEMDVFRQRDLAAKRVPTPLDDPIAFRMSHPKGQAMVRTWRERFTMLQRYVNEIGALTEANLGPEKAEAWRDRLRRLWCPDIYTNVWPDRMIEWLHDRPEATPEQVEAATTILAGYERDRERLRRDAITTGIAMTSALGTGAASDRAKLNNARVRWRMRELNEQTSRAFRAILTGEQQSQFDADLRAAMVINTNVMGPYIAADLLEQITGEHVNRGVLLGPVNPRTGERAYELDLEEQGVPHYELEDDQ